MYAIQQRCAGCTGCCPGDRGRRRSREPVRPGGPQCGRDHCRRRGRPRKVARVGALGATVAVDYLESGWSDRVRDALGEREVTVVLDGVGGVPGRQALRLLAAGGRLVVFGWSSGDPLQLTTMDIFGRSLTVRSGIGPDFGSQGRKRELETRALAEAAAGRLVPPVSRFRLADAAGAHRALESRETVGKTVLLP
jgi:NADPH:quinone reductase